VVSTPLYSNTTLVSFLPTVSNGGTVVLMPKFDVKSFLELSAKHRATHAMLVPVQYRRLMEYPDFDKYDLSSLKLVAYGAAPMPYEVVTKAVEVFKCGLMNAYGQTESTSTLT